MSFCTYKRHSHLAVTALAVMTLLHCSSADDNGENTAEGTLTIEMTMEPQAPITGQNTANVRVTDSEGQPVTGAQVTVDPQMPVHGHGSTEVPVVTEEGNGTYSATPVTFQMPGPWVVTVEAKLGEDWGRRSFDVEVK